MPTRKKRFFETPLLPLNPKPLSSSSSIFQPISMEIDGFLYETLQPLSSPTTTDSPPLINSPDLNSPDEHQYSVLRNQVPSSTLACPSSSSPTAAIDFFSLDVVDEEAGIRTPTSITESPVTEVKVNTELERNLEKGWFRANSKFKSPMLQLHKEILDFCEFLSPTPEEEVLRNEAVDGVFGIVKYIWPHCKVEVFGSFKTGLYLPTSDIDVSIE
ncbi:non-canonical poly(A) RNA polymerase PAPD5 [Thalictrum thalictroides]|uniref:Non-canonical poly(A) RNA polymerase PAPD5 n=1 Tax=Thalictrum thalictroides TaxID=46969 RepID=A0A7J6UU06_THATH|nr:non-canonical poly(A) RNA polymerase PAPD5 [Thalictrum thalictroides]